VVGQRDHHPGPSGDEPQVRPEGISIDVLKHAGSTRKMQVPTPAIFKDAGLGIVAHDRKLQTSVKRHAVATGRHGL